jgi:hypothetical protein
MIMKRNSLMAAAVVCLLASIVIGTQAKDQKPEPAFPKLVVVPFTIEPQPFEQASTRTDEDKIVQQLSEAATKQAERVLIARRVAATTERVASREAAKGQYVLTGVVRLPLSLPANVFQEAPFRRGRFAWAEVSLWNREGQLCARQEVQLVWGDGWWLYGGGRIRRHRALEDVLSEFAEKAADRAVNRIVRERGFRDMLLACDREMEGSK